MPNYKITYADGSTNNIIANEEWCKNIAGASYELNGEVEETQGMINARQREWRNNELLQTDFIVPLSDHRLQHSERHNSRGNQHYHLAVQ